MANIWMNMWETQDLGSQAIHPVENSDIDSSSTRFKAIFEMLMIDRLTTLFSWFKRQYQFPQSERRSEINWPLQWRLQRVQTESFILIPFGLALQSIEAFESHDWRYWIWRCGKKIRKARCRSLKCTENHHMKPWKIIERIH